MARASRTWLLTFTMAPEAHAIYGGLNCYPGEDRKVWTRQLQLYFKRVRKIAKGPLRYWWVLERHKSGLYHAHALLHEYGVAIREPQICGPWTLGFIRSDLVSDDGPKVARYVAKYLSKDEDAYTKASIRYGAETFAARRSKHSVSVLGGPVGQSDPPPASLPKD